MPPHVHHPTLRILPSEFCGNLASEGYVVVALEHRDRTGPIVFVKGEERLYTKPEQVTWEGGSPPSSEMPFRVDQLEMRRGEIYDAFEAFKRVVRTGDAGDLKCASKEHFNFSEWKDAVEVDADVVLAGHSFGSATAVCRSPFARSPFLTKPHSSLSSPKLPHSTIRRSRSPVQSSSTHGSSPSPHPARYPSQSLNPTPVHQR